MEQRLRQLAFQGIERWFREALRAVDPAESVRRTLRGSTQAIFVDDEAVPARGRVMVVGVGKAALAMVEGARQALGPLVSESFVLTKDGHAELRPEGVTVREAAHPIPDQRGVDATTELMARLSGLGPEDMVVALISGGGSALLEAPLPPVTLAEMAGTTDLLLRAGAPIQDLNRVRRALSRVKAGGLRRAAPEARFVTLLLSDVLGDDVRTIASGPTIDDRPDRAGARAALDQYGLRDRVPPAVLAALSVEIAAAGAIDTEADVVRVVANNGSAIEAAARAAVGDGLTVETPWRRREGEAADLARAWVGECLASLPEIDALVGGGEATVTVRGSGRGGRNTEFALAAALALEAADDDDWVVASLATDGQDALTGVAGAIVDAETARSARVLGLDPEGALADNDSLRVLEATGGLVVTVPTGTNVNDLYFAVRRSAIGHLSN